MMQNAVGKTKKSPLHDGDLSPRKRRRIVLILLGIYLTLSLIVILLGQKMSPAVYVCFVVPPLLLVFVLAMFAVKIDTSTRVRKILSIVKICLLVVVLFVITLGGQAWYKSFHLHRYRAITPGIVTKVTYDYSAKYSTTTYYVEIRFTIDGVTRNGYCTYSYKKYNEGDHVKIAYSYKDPDFYEIADAEN